MPGAARRRPAPPAPIDLADRPLGFPTKVPSNGVQNGVSMVFQCHVENPEKPGCKKICED